MPGTTTRGFPYPLGSEDVNEGDETIQALAERCRDEYSEGTFASRPSASTATAGRVYYATDTGDYWRDTGSGWRFERATARATCGVGSAASSGGQAPIASLTQSVSGAYSIASTTRLVVTSAGTYRATFRVRASSGLQYLSTVSVTKNASSPITAVDPPDLARWVSVSVDVDMAAADYLTVSATTSSGTFEIEWASIERVSP
jgi:hypothetical protein